MSIIIPPFVGDISPYSPSTGPLAYDETMLREPRLFISRVQPRGLVKVDWTNPLTYRLLDAVLATIGPGLYSAKTGRVSVNAGTPGSVWQGKAGLGFRTNTVYNTTNYDSVSCPGTMVIGTGCLTIFAHFYIISSGSDGSNYNSSRIIYGFSPTLANDSGMAITDGNAGIGAVGSFGANRVLYGSGWPAMGFVWHDPDGNYKAQFLGGAVTTITGGTTTPSGTVTTMGSQSGCFSSTSAPGDKALYLGMAWNRVLTQAERNAIFTDPYQFLIPA